MYLHKLTFDHAINRLFLSFPHSIASLLRSITYSLFNPFLSSYDASSITIVLIGFSCGISDCNVFSYNKEKKGIYKMGSFFLFGVSEVQMNSNWYSWNRWIIFEYAIDKIMRWALSPLLCRVEFWWMTIDSSTFGLILSREEEQLVRTPN